MGFVGIQFGFVQWQHILVGWHFSRSFVLFLENQVSTGDWRLFILEYTGIYVSYPNKNPNNTIFPLKKKLSNSFFFFLLRKHFFPDVRGGVHGFGVPPQNQRTDQPQPAGGNAQNRFFGGGNWGRGQRLGRD